MKHIIEKELSYALTGCIFDVHNEVGPGLREECYQNALAIRLMQAGIPFVAKPRTRRQLIWLGEVADTFEPDFTASDRVVVEVKVHPEGLPQAGFRQTMNYLKFWKFELGLLVNFAQAKADIRRVVFHETVVTPNEDFESIRGTIAAHIRDKLLIVREVILEVHRLFGLGYSDGTYRKLLEIGILHRGLRCSSEVIAQPAFREHRLPRSPITPLFVDETILVQVEAIHDGISLRAIRTMQTHIGCMNATVGIIASFGQSTFEVRGVRKRFDPRE